VSDERSEGAGRNLVVCCDGTWDLPDKLTRARARAPTNVTKLALGVAREDRDGRPQALFYQRGVGTRPGERLTGGVFAYGLGRNVRECYRFVVDNYEPDDRVFLLGFSRGAYTARSTAGLIRNCGILRREHRDRIDDGYALYKSRSDPKKPQGIESRIFRRMYSHQDDRIHFIGVWDTVGSVGIPLEQIRIPFVDRFKGFHDTELSSHVDHAFQALAIDEQRPSFIAAPWKLQPGAARQGQREVEQVWFAGVHKDVGGGYADDRELSEVTLRWMVHHARTCKLAFEPGHFDDDDPAHPATQEDRSLGVRLAPDPLCDQHNSRTGFWRLLWRHRRRMGIEVDEVRRPGGHSAAWSAFERLRGRNDYAPAELVEWQRRGWAQTPAPDGPWDGSWQPPAGDGQR